MPDSLVTALQEKLGNSILTVRQDGVVLGRVLQDRVGEWIILPPEDAAPRQRYPTLREVVAALVQSPQRH